MENDYLKSTHRMGKITTIIALLLMIMVPTVITLSSIGEVDIEFGKAIGGIINLSAIFCPLALTEVISYSPILGAGGSYLSFITGNVMNMKLPAATNALSGAGYERGSDEAEVISTLAIGASTLVTTFVLFLGMLFLGNILVPIISKPEFAPALHNIMPALLGAMAVPIFIRDLKLAVVPIGISILLFVLVDMSTLNNYLMLPFILVVVGIYILMYRFGLIKEDKK